MASALGVTPTSYSSEDVSELIKQINLQAGIKKNSYFVINDYFSNNYVAVSNCFSFVSNSLATLPYQKTMEK